uniref:Si:ch73-132f6.5 n=1 Tax=Haplochromis burtoni TaxID=8153 RepID=A0A3Q2WKI7_HAPBU
MSNFPQLLRAAPAPFRRLSCGRGAKGSLGFSVSGNFLRLRSSAALSSSPRHRNRPRTRGYTSYSRREPVRIGCASGFWGDTATAVPQLIYSGKLDFLVFDYLSEITMSLLTAAKTKMPNLGYAPDFVQVALAPFINDIHRKGIRVVSNAGGVNPLACAEAIQEVTKKAGLELKVAVVTGDDLMPHRSSLSDVKMPDGSGRQQLPKTLHSMNAYLGAVPIRHCLDLGADIVVTGRCVDSAVALGPLMHAFGWERNDYDLLAAGSLAGHLIECGAQSTGGIFTDWHKVPDWDNMGFPVVECSSDGSFVLSKPPKTGGLVSFGTVAEQLVYEIGDPRRYLLPDVICDFSQVVIQEVPVSGKLKDVRFSDNTHEVCFWLFGQRHSHQCPSGSPFVALFLKAESSRYQLSPLIIKFTFLVFFQDSREAVIWLAVHHKQKKALEHFSREVAPAGTGMGTTNPVISSLNSLNLHFCFFVLCPDLPSGPHSYRLEELAYARSGDKGDSANIGVVARHPLYFPYLKKHLTSSVVEEYFSHLIKPGVKNAVTRYTLPGIHGLNFVLQSSLGGGGVASLRSDPQGKAYGQMLLDLKLRGLPDLKSLVD